MVYMEIKDIQPNHGEIDVVAVVTEKEEPRTFEKFGKTGKVCNAKIKDDSVDIKLTLWNEDIENINVGDKIHVQNGWCSEFRDEKQLSSGKFGKIEVVEKAAEEQQGVLTNDPNMAQGLPPEGMQGGEESPEAPAEEETSEEPQEEQAPEDEQEVEEEEIKEEYIG